MAMGGRVGASCLWLAAATVFPLLLLLPSGVAAQSCFPDDSGPTERIEPEVRVRPLVLVEAGGDANGVAQYARWLWDGLCLYCTAADGYFLCVFR